MSSNDDCNFCWNNGKFKSCDKGSSKVHLIKISTGYEIGRGYCLVVEQSSVVLKVWGLSPGRGENPCDIKTTSVHSAVSGYLAC